MTDDLWRTLHSLAEEQGEHVRLSLGCSPPPLELTPSRCACAALVTPAGWSVLFEYRFRAPDHINVLELTALTSLIKHLAHRGARRQRILCCVDSRVVLGAVSKGRSSAGRLNFSASGRCLSNVSVLLCEPIYYGSHRGETLQTLRRAVPHSPTGNIRFRPGRLELQVSISGQPLLLVSSKCSANPCPQQPCKSWVLAVTQNRDVL